MTAERRLWTGWKQRGAPNWRCIPIDRAFPILTERLTIRLAVILQDRTHPC